MSANNESIITFDDFLTKDECDYLIQSFNDKVSKSTVVGGQVHSSRTSSTFYIPGTDPTIKSIRAKTAKLLNIPEENIEPIQFLRYLKGERYLYHHDYLAGNNIPNQRVHTLIVYLNTLAPEDGGATSFFHYKTKVVPKMGTAVWFKNMNDDGTLNTNSLHAGEEILKDNVIKYALNIWTRQSKY
jgi:prolyl 4-hydroxylase